MGHERVAIPGAYVFIAGVAGHTVLVAWDAMYAFLCSVTLIGWVGVMGMFKGPWLSNTALSRLVLAVALGHAAFWACLNWSTVSYRDLPAFEQHAWEEKYQVGSAVAAPWETAAVGGFPFAGIEGHDDWYFARRRDMERTHATGEVVSGYYQGSMRMRIELGKGAWVAWVDLVLLVFCAWLATSCVSDVWVGLLVPWVAGFGSVVGLGYSLVWLLHNASIGYVA